MRETERRRLLFEMDMAILELRETQGDTPAVVNLTDRLLSQPAAHVGGYVAGRTCTPVSDSVIGGRLPLTCVRLRCANRIYIP